MKNLWAFLIVGILSAHNLMAQELVEKGYRLPLETVEKNYSLMRVALEEPLLVKHITQYNFKISPVEAREIAQTILKTSKCFQIDPWVLTALIKKESSFQREATSPTGASGLTQFTGIGFQEVNDQLGIRGKVGATENAINYFNARINECASPNWIQLWDRIAVTTDHPDFVDLLKAELKEDIEAAIIYGAILLKTYVGYVDSKTQQMGLTPQLSEIYYQALQIYNGEEGERKVRYAKAVFRNLKDFYPREVNFPFLSESP